MFPLHEQWCFETFNIAATTLEELLRKMLKAFILLNFLKLKAMKLFWMLHTEKFDSNQKRPLFLGNICRQTCSIWSSCAEGACQNIRRRSRSRRQTKRHKQERLPGTALQDILPRGEGASLTLIRHTTAENNIKLNQVFLETWPKSRVLRLEYVKTGNDLD